VRKKEIAVNIEDRIAFERNHLGGYEVIFPTEDELHNNRFNMLINRAKSILYANIKKAEDREDQTGKKDNK